MMKRKALFVVCFVICVLHLNGWLSCLLFVCFLVVGLLAGFFVREGKEREGKGREGKGRERAKDPVRAKEEAGRKGKCRDPNP
jgi:hypothetical protein